MSIDNELATHVKGVLNAQIAEFPESLVIQLETEEINPEYIIRRLRHTELQHLNAVLQLVRVQFGTAQSKILKTVATHRIPIPDYQSPTFSAKSLAASKQRVSNSLRLIGLQQAKLRYQQIQQETAKFALFFSVADSFKQCTDLLEQLELRAVLASLSAELSLEFSVEIPPDYIVFDVKKHLQRKNFAEYKAKFTQVLSLGEFQRTVVTAAMTAVEQLIHQFSSITDVRKRDTFELMISYLRVVTALELDLDSGNQYICDNIDQLAFLHLTFVEQVEKVFERWQDLDQFVAAVQFLSMITQQFECFAFKIERNDRKQQHQFHQKLESCRELINIMIIEVVKNLKIEIATVIADNNLENWVQTTYEKSITLVLYQRHQVMVDADNVYAIFESYDQEMSPTQQLQFIDSYLSGSVQHQIEQTKQIDILVDYRLPKHLLRALNLTSKLAIIMSNFQLQNEFDFLYKVLLNQLWFLLKKQSVPQQNTLIMDEMSFLWACKVADCSVAFSFVVGNMLEKCGIASKTIDYCQSLSLIVEKNFNFSATVNTCKALSNTIRATLHQAKQFVYVQVPLFEQLCRQWFRYLVNNCDLSQIEYVGQAFGNYDENYSLIAKQIEAMQQTVEPWNSALRTGWIEDSTAQRILKVFKGTRQQRKAVQEVIALAEQEKKHNLIK